ncbi:MAG: UDP-N-acetylmuramoyl-L-alanine--D-glutamate ligase [Rheinheimera sp.]|uniref:UDP-N-acetylmuramoyl-L-alanine--D-glutamate ligase n=1 Tax=Arsukibacterium sp. UBA3155 TaxID=1946058 RepID=UPI000C91879C|nr:UDP-N-acetylmuramoyl-L-alanine--D-glutamate ligase [Arsukibacterium sp. UBA3155]MAD76654.1 UDP-N-acetylmuramoyl-L-alanine--D-glutamate ligase [Rheinheimera sp.]|tara:strand:+ start:80435 stop:81769 length:1335 start_codon:yes stop_codon:yes gene_type:complete
MQTNLNAKRIAVVGLGLSGLATVRFLLAHGVKPVLMDSRSKPAGLEQIAADKVDGIYLGEFDANRLAQMDMIIISPGLATSHPAIRFAKAQGVEVLGDVELFARFNQKPVIAITGSNGKSTVTTLVAEMLQQSGIKAVAAGNIGLPVLDAIRQQDTEVFVLELSSFQLDSTNSLRSRASCVLNVSADHLDRYADMAAYTASKQRVYQHTEQAVYNQADPLTYPAAIADNAAPLAISLDNTDYGIIEQKGQLWLNVAGEPLLPVSQLGITGSHNQFNALAAAALALSAGANRDAIARTLRQFNGLAHRCQLVLAQNGVRWVNDSKATNIGATLAAIAGLRSDVKGKLILIAGGDAKGADLSELRPVLTRDVNHVITLGQDGPAIAALHSHATEVKDLTAAVKQAAKLAQSGDMVLLSPACASLDMFKSYAERGELFARAVRELKL